MWPAAGEHDEHVPGRSGAHGGAARCPLSPAYVRGRPGSVSAAARPAATAPAGPPQPQAARRGQGWHGRIERFDDEDRGRAAIGCELIGRMRGPHERPLIRIY
jgi:hypothetical protein